MEAPQLLPGSFTEWLLKTRMPFYGHDLQLPWWFGLGCWSYALAGAVMLWTDVPKWMPTEFPFRGVALLLILVQSPLSFLADYVKMEHDSYWHVVDRCLAVPLMATEVIKFALMCHHSLTHHYSYNNTQQPQNDTNTTTKRRRTRTTATAMHPTLIVAYGTAMCLAVTAFLQSTAAQSNLDRDAFVAWHHVWHFYPLVASVIVLFDFYAGQGWKRSTRDYFYAVELHIIKQVQ